MGKFEIKKDKAGQFRFNLKARNGQIILTSDGYGSRSSCEDGILSVRNNAQIDDRFVRLEARDGSPYFKLMASNGRLLGASEMYSTKAAMENGVASVKQNAPSALVLDLSKD